MKSEKMIAFVTAENECLRLENQSLKEIISSLNKRIDNLENVLNEAFEDDEGKEPSDE